MKKFNKFLGVLLAFFLAVMPFTALKVLALDDTTPPTVPTNLAASLNASNQVSLGWTASTDNTGVSGYKVLRGNSVIATATSTSYLDSSVVASTTYAYSIYAFDANGNNSSSTAQVMITTGAATTTDTTMPTAPSALVGVAVSPTEINLGWTASTDNVGVTGYNIYKDGTWLASTSSTSFKLSGLKASTTYSFFIRAYDAKGNLSNSSNTLSISTLAEISNSPDVIAPSTPTNLSITATSSNSVKLGWTASTDAVGVAGYSIYRNGDWIAISTTNSFTDTGINPNHGYSYFVRAYDERGNVSGQSNLVFTSGSESWFENDTIAPSAPTNLTVSNSSAHSAKLSWTASTDNVEVVGYNIYRNGEWLANIDYSTTFVDNGLSASTAYSYYVRAYDMRGNMSGESNTVTITTIGSGSNDSDTNDGNIYQQKNNGNNGNHYGQMKNGNNGKHRGHDNNDNSRSERNRDR
ncbi:MAG: fibronectin type III domain-containing protein [Bacillota bacterium]